MRRVPGKWARALGARRLRVSCRQARRSLHWSISSAGGTFLPDRLQSAAFRHLREVAILTLGSAWPTSLSTLKTCGRDRLAGTARPPRHLKGPRGLRAARLARGSRGRRGRLTRSIPGSASSPPSGSQESDTATLQPIWILTTPPRGRCSIFDTRPDDGVSAAHSVRGLGGCLGGDQVRRSRRCSPPGVSLCAVPRLVGASGATSHRSRI